VPKLRLACAATALWASTTYAQAVQAPLDKTEQAVAQRFTCKPVEHEQNRIVATDLPSAITVALTFTDKKINGFKVSYVDDSGQKSKPADETKAWRLVAVPGRRDYSWYAVGNRDPNLFMHGRLFEQEGVNGGRKQWLYNEEQFELGVKTIDYHATCVEEQ
jgi:hypothetical protein